MNYIVARPPNSHQNDAYYNVIYVKNTNLPYIVEISKSPDFKRSLVVNISSKDIISDGACWINAKMREYLDVSICETLYARELVHSEITRISSITSILFEVTFHNENHVNSHVYNATDIRKALGSTNNSYAILTLNQGIIVWLPDRTDKILLKVLSIDVAKDGVMQSLERGRLDNNTSIRLLSGNTYPVRLEREEKRAFNVQSIDLTKLGVGGITQSFEKMMRVMLAPRLLDSDLRDDIGIKFDKGIICYGPPGTGKTLLARKLCEMLKTKPPKIVRGPDILSKYVGEAEKNVRDLFADAEKEYREKGENSDLHIIVFDEFDAIAGARRAGEGVGADINNKIVNQLLSVIDGVNSINNVLLIGLTNRKDMIDEALLRPGRFGVWIEFSLPDEIGRREIFEIHLRQPMSKGLVSNDVSIEDLAARSKNYTGAEIENVVRQALSYIIMDEIDPKNLSTITQLKTKLSHSHLLRALSESTPAYGSDNDLAIGEIIPHSSYFESVLVRINNAIADLRDSNITNNMSLLIDGVSGSGKRTIAIKAAIESNFPYIKIINPAKIIHYITDVKRSEYVISMFKESQKSKLSVLILEHIEDLIEFVPRFNRFSTTMFQAISTIISYKGNNNKLLIICTTSNIDGIRDLGLEAKFDEIFTLPLVSANYISNRVGYEVREDLPVRKAMILFEKSDRLIAK